MFRKMSADDPMKLVHKEYFVDRPSKPSTSGHISGDIFDPTLLNTKHKIVAFRRIYFLKFSRFIEIARLLVRKPIINK
jgi:hypothetical protein